MGFPLAILLVLTILLALRFGENATIAERYLVPALFYIVLACFAYLIALLRAWLNPVPILMLWRDEIEYRGISPFRIQKRDIERIEDIKSEKEVRIHFDDNGMQRTALISIDENMPIRKEAVILLLEQLVTKD